MAQNNDKNLINRQRDFYTFTTTRPVAILMVVIGVCVFGWISYKQLSLNLMPDISYPSLTVRTEYVGTAPEEIETTISRPIEQVLGVVNSLVSISSISKAGQSDVKLEYSWNTDMNQATLEVREKLDQLYLPEEVKRPLILRYDPTLDPIMRLGLYGTRSLFYMRYLAEEELKRILETVEGVAAVKVKGGLEEEIRVELDEQKLTLIGINIQQIKNRLMQENVNLAGGNLHEGQTEYLVRTLNEFKTVEEIAEVVVGHWNDREIKIRDIGRVSRTNKEREIITRINGHESVEIQIYKEADANIVAVAQRVKNLVMGTAAQQAYVQRLQAQETAKKDSTQQNQKAQTPEAGLQDKLMTNFIAHNLPEGIKIDVLSDQSIFIQNSVDEVKSTAILGGILAVIVLFVFLRNFTATLIVGISIPISIIATFAPMRMFDVTLNIMSLGGLALGIGMLVDNSIVVLESIARCREEGDDLIQATVRGVGEVGTAVFASTLTTVAVFFPIVFVEGVAGQIFGDLALTVVFSLLASLAVAIFLIPMLASRQGSQFIAGSNIQTRLRQPIFHFSTQDELNNFEVTNQNAGIFQKILNALKIIGKTLYLIIWKMLIITGALLVALGKFIVVFLAIFLLPFKFRNRILAFAKSPHWGKIEFPEKIWPTFLVNQSLSNFVDDLSRNFQTIKESKLSGKIFLGFIFIFKFIFYLIKFIVFWVFELIFRLIHFLLSIAGVLLKGLPLILKILLAPLIKAVFFGFNYTYRKIETAYPKILKSALEKRWILLGSVTIIFLISIFIVRPRLGSELIPEVHQGEFNVEVTLPVGTPVERTDERILVIQEYLKNQDGVNKISAVSGTDKTASSESEEGEHTAKVTVNLKRASNVLAEEERLINQVRDFVRDISGMNTKISRPVLFTFKTPIEVQIHGYDLQKLQEIANRTKEKMQTIPGLFDVKSNIQRGNPEVQIIYNRELISKYGLNIFEVASIVRNKVRGDIATKYKEQDRKIDILVRLQDEDKASIEALRRLIVNPDSEKPIPLEAVADIQVREGPSEIRRVEQQRTALVTANISGRDLQSVSEDIFNTLNSTGMPPGFTFNMAGQNKEMQTSMNSLLMALALAIFLVYIVMASQFESLIHPFIILFTIPLALIGVFIFLYLLNIPLSIVVFLGLIMLAGIVVNNAIVLVDYINQLRERGREKIAAIIEAGQVRLRPILMTTLTTVLGLLPMSLGLGDGAEIRTPMAITVIIGLASSTILTLVVIPVVYSLMDRRS
ncbi:efflux RND transporter permease subunit [candidate division KSB1 bacterium]|nr:efflux RND transporter permease subunit [candidate division KSB1 bacterium]